MHYVEDNGHIHVAIYHYIIKRNTITLLAPLAVFYNAESVVLPY